MSITKSEMNKGAHRYVVLLESGHITLSADSQEQAKAKAERMGKVVKGVTQVNQWQPASFKRG
jgi:hypothetical protein